MVRDLEKIVIREDASVRDAMQAIDRGGLEIALVVDRHGVLQGTLTDGDVRRALLGGAGFDDPVTPFVHRRFIAVSPSADRAEVLDLMRAHTISQIPMVDSEGRLAGLHLVRDILGASPRRNWAVIMAGGRGERLRPVTDSVPKPMIKIAGRPILERIVLHLVGSGIRQIFISLNYMAEAVEDHFADGSDFGCRIDYLHEESPLGTAGALSLLPQPPSDPLVVMNGDLLTQFDLDQMLTLHQEGGHVLTVGVREYVHSVPFGVLEIRDDRAVRLTEKPTEVWDINAGVYILQPELLARIPPATAFSMTDLIEQCLIQDEAVGAFRLDDDWLDIGRRDDLLRARGQDDT